MASVREMELLRSYRRLRKVKMISLEELDVLMYQIDKLLQNYHDLELSRDNWKNKYKELKKNAKETKDL